MSEEDIARLLEGIEMPTPAESFAHALESQVVATRPRRRAPLVALALVAAAAVVAMMFWPRAAVAPEAPEDPAATGLALAKAKRYKEAVAAFDRALAVHRGLGAMDGRSPAALHVNRAVALAYDGQLEEAQQVLQDVIGVYPDNPIAHADLAAVLFRSGDLDGAIRELREAIRLDPMNAFSHGGLAAAMLGAGEAEEALAAVDCALEMDPRSAYSHLLRAECLFAMGRIEEALAALDRAIELDPRDAHAHLERAQILRTLGRPDDAAAGEARARQLDPNVQPGDPGIEFHFVDPPR